MANIFKTTALMVALTVLLVWVGGAVAGQHGAWIALLLAGILNFGAWWFSDRVVLAAYGAIEVGPAEAPELHAMVRDLADRLAIPMPRLYIVPMAAPNAFATGRGPEHAAVAVTEGILARMPRDELRAVLAHELGHVIHRDTLISAIAATFAGAIGILGRMAGWGLVFGSSDRRDDGGPLGLLVAAILAPFAALLIHLAISRSRELHADAFAARLLGDGRPLARALSRLEAASEAMPTDVPPASAHLFIVNPRGVLEGVAALFRTHPPTEVRIRALEALSSTRPEQTEEPRGARRRGSRAS